MRRPIAYATLVVLGLLAACSDSANAPPPDGSGSNAEGGSDATSGDATTPPADANPEDAGATDAPSDAPADAPNDTGGGAWVPPVVATTSAGCGTDRADAWGVDSATPGGRTFHVWGPSGYDKNKTYPVVIMFHGIQSNGRDFESWFKMEDYTNNEAFVVYPDAAPEWDTWGDKDVLFFDAMVKQLGQTYCINPSRVLAFGYSWGGHFVDRLGCQRAGYVKAMMIGAGGTSGAGGAGCGRLPVLVTTRALDYDEPPANAQGVASKWVGINQCGAAGAKAYQNDTVTGSGAMGWCQAYAGCKTPGSVKYCYDDSSMAGIPYYDPSWDHTVREYYRWFAFEWFKALP